MAQSALKGRHTSSSALSRDRLLLKTRDPAGMIPAAGPYANHNSDNTARKPDTVIAQLSAWRTENPSEGVLIVGSHHLVIDDLKIGIWVCKNL